MRITYIPLAAAILITSMLSVVSAQTAAPKNTVLTGDVVSVDSGKIILRTKDGELSIILSDKTEFKKVPPENPVLKAAVAAALTDISEGDKLLVTGMISEDKKTLPAKSVYLMTKGDIAERQQKEKERWATRGISGKIKTVNADTNQITVDVSSLAGTTSVVITPKPESKFRRYAPNSVKYSEAKASSFSELQAGDVLRAVGERSADGASFAAEEIVSGAFQTFAGTVKSIDTAKNEVVITELQSKKDVTVDLGSASLLKKFPEQMAQMMAARQAAAAGGGGFAQGSGQSQGRPVGGQTQMRPGGGMGGPGGPRGGIDEMLERFPSITAADLKVGEMIAVSSTKTTSLDRITAIKLLAGVEPFIRAAQASAAGNQRGQGRQSLSIPGLDGFDTP